jgi:hypothetical protein
MVIVFIIGCTEPVSKTRKTEMPLNRAEADAESEILEYEEGEGTQSAELIGQAYITNNPLEIYYLACEDIDRGKNYERASSTMIKYNYKDEDKAFVFHDVCYGKVLVEYYCRGNRPGKGYYTCDNSCIGGRCI